MKSHKWIAAGALVTALSSAAVVGAAAPAVANDDTRRVTGDCSGSSEYTFRLSDSGKNLYQQKLRFFINGERGQGREWTVTIYKDGDKVDTLTKKTNSKGNVDFYKTLDATDDDADIRVYAKAGYGETCRRTLDID